MILNTFRSNSTITCDLKISNSLRTRLRWWRARRISKMQISEWTALKKSNHTSSNRMNLCIVYAHFSMSFRDICMWDRPNKKLINSTRLCKIKWINSTLIYNNSSKPFQKNKTSRLSKSNNIVLISIKFISD